MFTGWASGSYCILAGATHPHCPPGFSLIETKIGNIKVANLDGWVIMGSFGMSNVGCYAPGHLTCGQHGTYVQLQNFACCK